MSCPAASSPPQYEYHGPSEDQNAKHTVPGQPAGYSPPYPQPNPTYNQTSEPTPTYPQPGLAPGQPIGPMPVYNYPPGSQINFIVVNQGPLCPKCSQGSMEDYAITIAFIIFGILTFIAFGGFFGLAILFCLPSMSYPAEGANDPPPYEYHGPSEDQNAKYTVPGQPAGYPPPYPQHNPTYNQTSGPTPAYPQPGLAPGQPIGPMPVYSYPPAPQMNVVVVNQRNPCPKCSPQGFMEDEAVTIAFVIFGICMFIDFGLIGLSILFCIPKPSRCCNCGYSPSTIGYALGALFLLFILVGEILLIIFVIVPAIVLD